MSSTISDINLAFLDASDTIIEIVTYDSTTIHNTIAMADTFRSIGYPASKVQYLINRADSAGGIEADDLHRALGRVPEHRVVSDGQLVVRSNNEGVPFVLADPNAAGQPGHRPHRRRAARRGARAGRGRAPLAGRRVRPTTDRRLRLGGRRPDRPAGDRPAPAPRVDDLPRRQRPRAVRAAHRRRGPALLDRGPRRARRARRQGPRRRLQHLHGGRHRRVPAALRPAGPRASSGPAPRRPRCRRATGGSASSPRRRRSARTPTSTRSRTRTRPSRSTSTPRRRSCRWSRPGCSAGPRPRRRSRRRWRRCSASATRTASRSSRGHPARRSTRSCSGCTHYPLIRPVIAAAVGDRIAIVDSATATASALSELLVVNGLEAPGTTRGTAADAGLAGHERPDEVPGAGRSAGWPRPATRSASATSPCACSGRTCRRSSRSSSGCSRDDRSDPGPSAAGAGLVARRPRVAGRHPHRLGAGRGRDRRRSTHGAPGARGPRRLAGRRTHRHRPGWPRRPAP